MEFPKELIKYINKIKGSAERTCVRAMLANRSACMQKEM